MAKASVKTVCITCGAEFTATKDCYNRADANRWESSMQNGGTCKACWANEKQGERQSMYAKKSKEHAELAEEYGLPKLEGSEKQIAWAETLRVEAAFLSEVSASQKINYKGRQITEDDLDELQEKMEGFFKSQTSAKFYIDNRNNSKQDWVTIFEKFAS